MPASAPDTPRTNSDGRPTSPYLSGSVLGALLLTLALTAIAAGLGIWQLNAWKAERDLNAIDRTTQAAVPIADVLGPDDPMPGDGDGRPVLVEGTWVSGSTVLVPDRTRNGESGWWVATAVTPTGQESSIYVVRDFTVDPDQVPAEPTGELDSKVWLQAGEGAGPQRDTNPDDNRISAMRTVELLHHVDGDLYSGFAVIDQEDVTPVEESSIWTGLQNFFYAFEWWVFGGFVVFMFARFLWELKQRRWEEQAAAFAPDELLEPAGDPVEASRAQAPSAGATGLEDPQQAESANGDLPGSPAPTPETNSLRDRLNDVTGVLTRYRLMANIVGVLLIVILLIGIPLKYFTGGPMWGLLDSTPAWFTEGSSANELGDWITHYLGVAHGWLYMIFLFAAFQLAMRCRWKIGFSALVLLCGTIPIVSFWAEHRAVKAARLAFPEELGRDATTSASSGA